MASLEHIGRQWHPDVTHYQSGGIGHRQGDETKSVVGFLPTETVAKFREHDGHWGTRPGEGTYDWSRDKIDRIKGDIQAGKGIHEPLVIDYNHREGWAYLGEGNHRLRAAEEAGAPVVPVRVYGRSHVTPAKGVGSPLRNKRQFDIDPSYSPPDIHPDHFEF